MKVHVALENGLLPDAYGKYAPEEFRQGSYPIRSFPIDVDAVPDGTASLALTFLDWDAIPVGGFCWIHWIACNIPATCTHIPENASRTGEVAMVQGSNSDWSPFAGGNTDPALIHGYAGPCPPDKTHDYTLTVYALDCELALSEGYYLNEFRRAIRGHVLAHATVELPSRA